MRKTKAKFNWMDAIILLVLAAVVIGLLYVFVLSDTAGSSLGGETVSVTYVVEISGVSPDYKDRVSVGQAVIDSAKKSHIGTVTAIEAQPYTRLTPNRDSGTLSLSPVEDQITLYITVTAEAGLDGYTYSIGGYPIYVGATVHMSMPSLICSGYCISLDVETAP